MQLQQQKKQPSPTSAKKKAPSKKPPTELIEVTEGGERVGVIVKRPEYLSNFTIDKDKMDFFT